MAGDKFRFFGAEPDYRFCHFVGLAQPSWALYDACKNIEIVDRACDSPDEFKAGILGLHVWCIGMFGYRCRPHRQCSKHLLSIEQHRIAGINGWNTSSLHLLEVIENEFLIAL